MARAGCGRCLECWARGRRKLFPARLPLPGIPRSPFPTDPEQRLLAEAKRAYFARVREAAFGEALVASPREPSELRRRRGLPPLEPLRVWQERQDIKYVRTAWVPLPRRPAAAPPPSVPAAAATAAAPTQPSTAPAAASAPRRPRSTMLREVDEIRLEIKRLLRKYDPSPSPQPQPAASPPQPQPQPAASPQPQPAAAPAAARQAAKRPLAASGPAPAARPAKRPSKSSGAGDWFLDYVDTIMRTKAHVKK